MSFDAIEELYREEIMEHYNNPQNYGKLEKADVSYRDSNPVCGDEIEVQLRIETPGITDVAFNGKGCAISQAAASIITEKIKGMKPGKVLGMKQNDVLELLRISPGPVRIKCAMLALRAIQKAIVRYEAENEKYA